MKVACIGECMIELGQIDLPLGQARVGFAGDSANTAIYLSRLGVEVSYLSVVGQDAFSTAMLAMLAGEGIDTRLIGRHPTRLPGLYAIETDAQGERSFRYWREASAARTLFDGPGPELADLDGFDVIFLSGISLAILPPEVRGRLIGKARGLRDAGKAVVFDPNYRPRLWPDAATARGAFTAMWAATTLALPSFDDELALDPAATPDGVIARIAAAGVGEVVLKNGAAGPRLWQDGATVQTALPPAGAVVDTTGAGDSFNAGYLAARLGGAAPQAAAAAGHALARRVIAHHGAVIPRETMAGWDQRDG